MVFYLIIGPGHSEGRTWDLAKDNHTARPNALSFTELLIEPLELEMSHPIYCIVPEFFH